MISYLKKLKTAFQTTFTAHPRTTYNFMFWSVILVVFLWIYLSAETAQDKAVYVKRAISELKDKKQLDTLNQLLNGNEVIIRNFPFIKTYRIVPNRRTLIRNEEVVTDNYISTDAVSFFQVSNNSYMIKDAVKKKWTVRKLPDELIFSGADQGVGYNSNYRYKINGGHFPVIPLEDRASNSRSFLALQDTGIVYRIPDTFSVTQLLTPFLFRNSLVFYKTKSHNGRDTTELRMARFRQEGNYVDSKSVFIDGTVSSRFFHDLPNCNFITFRGDSLFFTQVTRAPAFNNAKSTLLPLIKHPNVNSYSTFRPYLIQSTTWPILFIDSNERKISFYSLDNTGGRLLFEKHLSNGFHIESTSIFGSLVCLLSYKGDSLQLIKAAVADTTVNYREIALPGDKLRDAAIYYNSQNTFLLGRDGKDERHLIYVTEDGKYQESESDKDFLKFTKGLDIYLTKQMKDPEFIIDYPNELAVVSAQKIDSKYDYKIIGNINWPVDAFDVYEEIDPFYIILLVAFVITLYFSLYFSLRSFFANRIRPIDYDSEDSVFKRVPTLTGKIKMVENIVKILMLRSDTMLGLGVIFGVGGVLASIIVFQITEPGVTSWSDPHTILGIIRPVILLAFIETFTFFFLKQYRIIFNEYKLFYSVYLRLLNYYHIIECDSKLRESVETAKDLKSALLTEKFELYEQNTRTAINEFDDNFIIKLLEKYGDAFKQGKGQTNHS